MYDYRSKQSKRIVRSIMAGDLCAFIDRFDLGFSIAADLLLLIDESVEIYMYADSKQLFDAMKKGKRRTEG